MKKRAAERIRNAVTYIRSHFILQVTCTVIVLLLLAGVTLQLYVKNQYFNFLLKSTRDTQETVISALAGSINNSLKEAVATSCSIALDESLCTYVENAVNSEDSYGRDILLLRTQLSQYTLYASTISIAVVTEEGLLQDYGRYWSGSGYDSIWSGAALEQIQLFYTEVMELMIKANSIRYSAGADPVMHENIRDMQMFHVAVPLVGNQVKWDDVDTVVVVSFRLDQIFEKGNSDLASENPLSKVYLTDENGRIIYHEKPKYIGMQLEEYQKQIGNSETISQKLDYFGWTSHITLDVAAMREEVNRLYRSSVYVYLGLLLMCALIWQLLLRKVLHPLSVIREAMQEIRLEEPMEHIEICGSHEVWQLAEHYNAMTDKLEEQREQIRRHYKEKTRSIELRNKAEREALEAQINAHFLCNTLTAINYDAVENGAYEVAAHLKMLSSILSYTFSRKLTTVTLGQEIQWVEQYLSLQKFRLMEVFDYEIDFPQEYGEWPCCKLFLQPFVENSILHGFEGRESGGKITIAGTIVEHRFMLKVQDNGCGMKPETEELIQNILQRPSALELDRHGIGIQNVVTRLRMYYGADLDIRLRTKEGEGCCFMFWLPIPEQPVEHAEDLME